ncbi:hypothetical protein IGI04_014595 [Brassica rapa subsp. trilocularis]|uniref:Uncharacterized protein n=1 Tax=Brassica rapa subsp. trilocularis TaxID=1813537 RepID=A0ABQ7MP58_BRACM|nr:hypothetical protein IGI04_014595 [Brassica rapa subsp. trilocularis]
MFCCLIWNVSNYAILISHHHVVCYISHWLLPLLYSHCAVHQLLILIIKIWRFYKFSTSQQRLKTAVVHQTYVYSQFGFCGNTSDYCVVGCQQGP